jgi:hypothetical protein
VTARIPRAGPRLIMLSRQNQHVCCRVPCMDCSAHDPKRIQSSPSKADAQRGLGHDMSWVKGLWLQELHEG